MKISIEVIVNAPIQSVWDAWVTPADIQQWNQASPDWHCPSASVDLREGGVFSARMEAKDGSFGFDFSGIYTKVEVLKCLEYALGEDTSDARRVTVEFSSTESGVLVTESFDVEDENSAEMQRQGWLNILNSFKNHVESKL